MAEEAKSLEDQLQDQKQSLEEKILKLETDLYFCNRNKRIEKHVQVSKKNK